MTTQATAIEERFRQLHPRSASMAEEAYALFPNGVTHDARRLAPFPIYMDRGKGPRKWDVDGNEYIDYRVGHGSMILGQANPAIVRAVQAQVEKGTHLGASSELEVKWGQLVRRLVPSVEKMRFHSSGTEANMMAFKMVRAFTRKSKIVKFRNSFHGWSDYAYALDPEQHRRFGIPEAISETMVVVPDHDLDTLDRALADDDDIAAVVYMGNDISPPEFIRGMREVTERRGVLLIFDEVVSGFRWSRAGCQGRIGVRPDLSTFAKILAGGLPGGCVAGRGEIVDTIGQGGIAHPGTFNANPLSAAAGVAALSIIEKEPILETAEAMAGRLRQGINETLRRLEIPGGAFGVASSVSASLGIPVDTSYEYATPDPSTGRPVSAAARVQLRLALANEGVWGDPGAAHLSATHTAEDIDATVEKYEAALREVRKTGAI